MGEVMTKKQSHHEHTHVYAEEGSRSTVDSATVLRTMGFRVTSGRVALLALLEVAGTPLSVQDVHKKWQGSKSPDIATLYRSLTDLQAAGIVRRIDLGTGTAHFEYTPARPHHHHIICNGCGAVEELEHCSLTGLEAQLLLTSQQFKSIYSHNLEFFGECTSCAAKK